jgi:hypothetical protein
MERFGFSMSDAETDDVLLQQTGVFRVNCLDCLDRTNFVEDILSRTALEQFLSLVRREWTHANTLWNAHRDLWANNGDALSKIYAGTGALNTSFTRTGKRTFAGLVSDATKSVSRAYINNFQDKNKQAAIDMFLVSTVVLAHVGGPDVRSAGNTQRPAASYHFRPHSRQRESGTGTAAGRILDAKLFVGLRRNVESEWKGR